MAMGDIEVARDLHKLAMFQVRPLGDHVQDDHLDPVRSASDRSGFLAGDANHQGQQLRLPCRRDRGNHDVAHMEVTFATFHWHTSCFLCFRE